MRYKLIFLVLVLSCQSSFSQKSFSLFLFDEHIINQPFGENQQSPTHPGIQLSYEKIKKEKGSYKRYQSYRLGYFFHKDLNQLVFIGWKPTYEFEIAKLIDLQANFGLAYAHSFPTQVTYELNEEKVYKKEKNFGKSHFMPSIGATAGVNLENNTDIPMKVLISYEIFSLLPNSRRLPISFHSLRGVGLQYSF